MTSKLSLAVEDLRVIVRIDGDDVSRAGGNGGPDPWHVLVPVNRFAATAGPATAIIACCPGCGPDCYVVDARISREGGVVRWDWGRSGPRWEGERRTVRFAAEAYDAEVERFAADRSWETPDRRAGRAVLTGLELPAGLVARRVQAGRAGLMVTLEDPDYQIWVTVPWDEARADEIAGRTRELLAGPPAAWPARWHRATWQEPVEPPAYAGPDWQRLEF